jgi:coatomer subunit beta
MTISHERALTYISNTFDGIPNVDELLQLVEIEFIRKDAVQNAANKARYLRLIFDLLEAGTSTVAYEAATALTALTNNPVAVKAAATKLIELCVKEADNNVKLIVLDKVETLRQQHGLDDSLTMEVLRVLTSPDLDVRKKALGIALELVSSKNIDEMLLLLRKELQKSTDSAQEKADEYRQLLIRTISQCAIQYPAAAEGVVDTLITFIADNNAGAIDVISFLKEVCETMPKLRPSILEKLAILSDVRSGKVQRGVLWLVSEYSSTDTEIRSAWQRIRTGLGEIPILQSENRLLEEANEQEAPEDQVNGHSQPKPAKTRLAADGTYQTESALTAKLETVKAAQKPPLRQLILDGDFFLATVLASSLVKLVMRHSETSAQQEVTNALRSEAMLILVSIIRVGQSHFVKAPIDEDSVDRIMSSVHVLAEFSERTALKKALLDDTRQAFRAIVQVEEKKRAEKVVFEKQKAAVGVDDLFSIRQLAKKSEGHGADEIGLDLDQAMGGDSASEDLTSKLSRVVQLTGFSDPVYAEAYVKVHQFDIVLDVLLVNQTNETLQSQYQTVRAEILLRTED